MFYLNKNPGKGRRNTMKQRKNIAALSLLLAEVWPDTLPTNDVV